MLCWLDVPLLAERAQSGCSSDARTPGQSNQLLITCSSRMRNDGDEIGIKPSALHHSRTTTSYQGWTVKKGKYHALL